MSSVTNKAIVRQYLEEVWNARKLAVAEDLVAAEYEPMPGAPRGPEGARAVVRLFLAAFPDFLVTVREMVADDEQVAVHYQFEGTHGGPWIGIEPTGRRVLVEGLTLYRLFNQRIVHTVFSYDSLKLVRQLGAALAPSA